MGTRNVLAAVLLIGAAGCGDATIKKLSANITRDSVMKILAAADAGTTIPATHVYREAQYFLEGKVYRVLFYTPTDRTEMGDSLSNQERLADDDLTPLVIVNDTLTGWGWQHWTETAGTINLELPPRR